VDGHENWKKISMELEMNSELVESIDYGTGKEASKSMPREKKND